MNDILKSFFEAYGEWSIVYKIAFPVAIMLGIAFQAFFLWAAARIISDDEFSYSRGFLITAAEFVVMFGVGYVIALALLGNSIYNPTWLNLIASGGTHQVINLAVLVALLVAMAQMSVLRAALVWGVRFVLFVHVGWFIAGTMFIAAAMTMGAQTAGSLSEMLFLTNLITGVLLLIASLAGLVLWMAGALASAEKLSFLRALLLAWVKGAVLVGLFFLEFKFHPLANLMPEATPLQFFLILGGILAVVNLILVVVGSMLLAGTSIGRGILIWFLELPLWALIGALVVGIDMVSLSIIQTAQTPEGAKGLEYVGIGLLGAVGGALLIYFGGQIFTPSVSTPRRSAT